MAVFVVLYHQFFEHHCPSRAASLAYATLLSLVPLMIVGFYILSWFPVFHGAGDTLQEFVVSNFVPGSANIVSRYLNDFLSHLHELSMTNMGFLGLVSVLMIYNMVSAFNEIWQVKLEMHFAIAFGIYLLVLLFAPLLFGALLVLLSYFSSLPFIVTAKAAFIKKPFIMLLPNVFEFLVFSFFNWVLPSCKVRLGYAVIAGFLTMVLFEVAKYGFIFYLKFVPTYRLLYGALSTIPLFLVWMYLSWLIILFGALVCQLMARGLPKKP